MSREDAQMRIRLPPDLKWWVTQTAARERRTLNAQIVWSLEQAMREAPESAAGAPVEG